MRLIDADALIEYKFKNDISYNAFKSLVQRQPTIDQVKCGEWVPCSERLPEEKKAVYWACNDSGEQFECRWTNASPFSGREIDWDWHWNIFDVPQYSKVVAWMPLPEPYKEQEDEEDRPTQISAEFAKLMTEGEIKVSNIDVSEFGRKRRLVIITAERNEE